VIWKRNGTAIPVSRNEPVTHHLVWWRPVIVIQVWSNLDWWDNFGWMRDRIRIHQMLRGNQVLCDRGPVRDQAPRAGRVAAAPRG
jgi:hypothetical protein